MTNLPTPATTAQPALPGLQVSPVGITGLADIDEAGALELIGHLDRSHSSLNWWLGDFAVEQLIRARDGDRSLAAVPMLSDQPANARAVKVSIAFIDHTRRRPGLSWTHHHAVSHLAEADADRLLDRAEHDNLNAHTLAALVRSEREALSPPLDDGMNRRAPQPPKGRIREVFAAHPHGGYVASFTDPDRLIPLDAETVARLQAAMGSDQ